MNDSSTQSPTSDAAQPDLRTVVNFLCGNGMLFGRWFFDGPPTGETDRFWWRGHLRAAFANSAITTSAEEIESLKGRICRIGLDIDRALAGQIVEQSPVAGRLKQIAALACTAAAGAKATEPVPASLPLRDHFATIALKQLIADRSEHGWYCHSTARDAYNMADAMLQARAAEKPLQEGGGS